MLINNIHHFANIEPSKYPFKFRNIHIEFISTLAEYAKANHPIAIHKLLNDQMNISKQLKDLDLMHILRAMINANSKKNRFQLLASLGQAYIDQILKVNYENYAL
tara:strand:- start:5391 stop:5705 length:315 start_codon:yes stop_codon:yes gene_type:complete